MVRNSKGTLSGNTKKLKKRRDKKNKLTVVDIVRTFKAGDPVFISQQAYRYGMPHLRYKNRLGVVVGEQGGSYQVKITDGNKEKILVCSSVHLKLA